VTLRRGLALWSALMLVIVLAQLWYTGLAGFYGIGTDRPNAGVFIGDC
jgi:hypothetical protein